MSATIRVHAFLSVKKASLRIGDMSAPQAQLRFLQLALNGSQSFGEKTENFINFFMRHRSTLRQSSDSSVESYDCTSGLWMLEQVTVNFTY